MKKALLLLLLFFFNSFAYSGETLVSNSAIIGNVSINITTPNQITDLVLWLDAADSSTITPNGNKVSVLADKSGLGNDATQGDPDLQPIFNGPLLNEKIVLHFDGVNDFMFLPSATDLGIVNSDYEILIVFRTAASSIQFLISGSVVENYEIHINGDVGFRFLATTLKRSDIGVTSQFSDGLAHIAGARVQNNIAIARISGADSLDTETPARSSETGLLHIGRRGAGVFVLDGDIGEVIIYKRGLLFNERLRLENYLDNKWGIN